MGHRGGSEALKVKAPVVLEPAVGRLVDKIGELSEHCDLLIRQTRDAFGQRQSVEVLPHTVELDEGAVARACDPGAAVRHERYESFIFELTQGFPDGISTRPIVGRDVLLREALAWPKFTGQYGLSELRGYSFRQGQHRGGCCRA